MPVFIEEFNDYCQRIFSDLLNSSRQPLPAGAGGYFAQFKVSVSMAALAAA